MKLKKLYILFLPFLLVLNAKGQNSNSDSNDDTYFEIFLGGNFNFTPSSSYPLNFWAFYEFDYSQINSSYSRLYSPLLIDLNWKDAKWSLKPQRELGIKLHKIMNDEASFGLNFVFTQNRTTAIVSNETDSTKAQLIFEGSESRIMIQPSVGFLDNRFRTNFNLILGLGINKDYDTYLIIDDEFNNQNTFSNYINNFYTIDYSVGLGVSASYNFFKGLNIGLAYNLYRVNISPYIVSGIFDGLFRFTNGFWNNSISLRLGVELF